MKPFKNLFFITAVFCIFFSCSNPKEKIESEFVKTDKNVLFIVVDDLNITVGA